MEPAGFRDLFARQGLKECATFKQHFSAQTVLAYGTEYSTPGFPFVSGLKKLLAT
jgi:hypothetical protein